jgi:hypothetical protein
VIASSLLAVALLLQAGPARAVGAQFGLEFAIDAPWRLEPVNGTYGPIPIVITFHDAIFESTRSPLFLEYSFLTPILVGKVTEVIVEERLAAQSLSTRILPTQLREIERKNWLSTKEQEPLHDTCRPFLGQNCDALLDISPSHEWHAMFWYTPKASVAPGRNIHLVVTLRTNDNGLNREWVNMLVVHAGDAPLPRFGNNWLYGDLHYHSQMTDNEGESGYSYRNVVRALGAMGMDFVFATDHASNGSQKDGQTSALRCGGVNGAPCTTDGQTCQSGGQTLTCKLVSGTEARDLNPSRFAAAKTILYGPDGANQAVQRDADTNGLARFRAAGILPQIYMGEEVDAWPEMSSAERQSGSIKIGNGLQYFWYLGGGDCRDPHTPNDLSECQSKYTVANDGGFLLLDEQGMPIEELIDENLPNLAAEALKLVVPDKTDPHPSRQHMVYLPRSNSLTAEGFIGSNTGEFGGAGKRLPDVLREVEAGGFAFLAHPLENASSGNSSGSNAGPDVVPYSDRALDRAWRSPGVLGLQLWNENSAQTTGPRQEGDKIVDDSNGRISFLWPFSQTRFPWVWRPGVGTVVVDGQLSHGGFTWDRYLRKGLQPAQTSTLAWLPSGQPRKWFIAGGSDAHGDLNYRRHGRPCKDRWCEFPVSDTAIGKPRNLVRVMAPPTGGRHGNRQVIDALAAGAFSVTDGPALRIAIDRNASGKIEDTDLQMGAIFDLYPGEHIPLLVEWKSTPEFGEIRDIDVYLGNALRTFAPNPHGPLGAPTSATTDVGFYRTDPSGVLKIKPASAAAKEGLAKLFLTPAQFGLVATGNPLFYVRAFARTTLDPFTTTCPAGERCDPREAFTNPIWGRYHAFCPILADANQATLTATPTNRAAPSAARLSRVTGALATARTTTTTSTATTATPTSTPTSAPTSAPITGTAAHVDGATIVEATALPHQGARDQDGNNFPDACERDIPNPCPLTALTGGSTLDSGGTSGTSGSKPPPASSCRFIVAAPPVLTISTPTTTSR